VVGACTYVLTVLTPAMTAIVAGAGARLLHLLVTLDRLAVVADSGEPPPAQVSRIDRGDTILVGSQLTFAYRSGARPVLDGLDLRLRRGELLAVVGASGSGKSTFALLVAGLLTPTGGTIAVTDDAKVCLVPQESYVFAGTLRENLAYLAPHTGSADLDACVDAVGLRRLADRIGGLDAALDPDSLAPDARQRIVAGRVHLGRADLLVLDEAMCHLDAATEVELEGLLRSTGATLVVVAHRLDVTTRADQVLYFDGRNVTSGSHAQLRSVSSSYDELLNYPTSSEGMMEAMYVPGHFAASPDDIAELLDGSHVVDLISPLDTVGRHNARLTGATSHEPRDERSREEAAAATRPRRRCERSESVPTWNYLTAHVLRRTGHPRRRLVAACSRQPADRTVRGRPASCASADVFFADLDTRGGS